MKKRPERHPRRDVRLLVRYVTGACAADEAAEVEARLAVDEKLARLLDELEKIWKAADESTEEVDVGRLRERFYGRIRQEQQRKIKRLPAAASARPRRPSTRKRPSPWRSFFRVVAVAAVIFLGVWGAYHVVPKPTSEAPAPKVFTTAPGQQASLRLADGTNVRLSVSSRLTVPVALAEGTREVELEGEAFFEVAPEPDRPFHVRAVGTVVQALGTAFAVRAYADEALTQVAVAEGRVALQPTPDAEALVLEPRQMVQIAGGRPGAVLKDADIERLMAWREGRLVFEEAPFEDVARELERWYGFEVEFADGARPSGRLNTTFTDESPSEVLRIVSLALQMDYQREGQRVTFSPSSP